MKDYKIRQIIPVDRHNPNYGALQGSIIGMTLIEKQGKQCFTYIQHDRSSSQPVLQDVTLTQPQEKILEGSV